MRHAEDQGYLGEDQHGSRSERRANDAALEKTLVLEHARVTRTSIITIDNDAKSCYVRIIRVLGMTARMNMGSPIRQHDPPGLYSSPDIGSIVFRQR
jgi:hypothetical protein